MWQITVEAPLLEDYNSFLTLLFSQLASQTGSNPSTAAGNTPPDMPSSPQDEEFPECDWSEHYCPDGVKYYYNCVTCESRVMFQLFDLLFIQSVFWISVTLVCDGYYSWSSGRSLKSMPCTRKNLRSSRSWRIIAAVFHNCRHVPPNKLLKNTRCILRCISPIKSSAK